jgi:hypothetical protein
VQFSRSLGHAGQKQDRCGGMFFPAVGSRRDTAYTRAKRAQLDDAFARDRPTPPTPSVKEFFSDSAIYELRRTNRAKLAPC